jgi:hypothetical protein
VLIAGFIVTGTQPKKVLLRGIGPTLPVIANLADPTLELHAPSGRVMRTNDNWRDTQPEDVQATTIPPSDDHESAMVESLTPHAYTVILAGRGATSGVGLVEAYDLDPKVDSKFANISTRGFVGRGDDVLIGGTIIVGSGSTSVLFRAIGPSLANVPNPLHDPMLELHDSHGTKIATNDNWQDTQAAEIKATTIPPANLREAAILRRLTPGAYTAVVRGKDDRTGVALIEAYQLN